MPKLSLVDNYFIFPGSYFYFFVILSLCLASCFVLTPKYSTTREIFGLSTILTHMLFG